MNWRAWAKLPRLPRLLAAPRAEPAQHQQRILTLQRDVVLPAKLVVVGVVFYFLYFSEWVGAVATTYGVVLETMRSFFDAYILLNLLVAVSLYVIRRWPRGVVQWVVFTIGLVDGVFLGGLTLMTGGFDSILYWVFPGLIVLNALCIPLATPQLVLNLALSAFFLGAGLLQVDLQASAESGLRLPPRFVRKPVPRVMLDEVRDPRAIITRLRRQNDEVSRLLWSRFPEATQQKLVKLLEENKTEELQSALLDGMNHLLAVSQYMPTGERTTEPPDDPTEPFLLRLTILWLLAFCCYGVQVLAARQHQAEEEQQEFTARTEQLHAAGRLAAEVAHQIKNPLAIINNTAFSLERALDAGRGDSRQQIKIIREEVEKADRIITRVMGYAELSEGRVEKLDLVEEMDRALERVFPPGVDCGTEIHRDYTREFPPLLMQRGHLAEVFVNLLQNARDVLGGKGRIDVTAHCRADDAIEVVIADDGPGIPADKIERIFEAYYTMRPKGTGLGLAIVKHNAELYGGTVRVESELGKGTRFTVVFPASTAVNRSRQS